MKHRIRKNDFNPMWSALRLPGSGWVSELLTAYLASSHKDKPRIERDHKITKDKAAGSQRPVLPGRPGQLQECPCGTAGNCS